MFELNVHLPSFPKTSQNASLVAHEEGEEFQSVHVSGDVAAVEIATRMVNHKKGVERRYRFSFRFKIHWIVTTRQGTRNRRIHLVQQECLKYRKRNWISNPRSRCQRFRPRRRAKRSVLPFIFKHPPVGLVCLSVLYVVLRWSWSTSFDFSSSCRRNVPSGTNCDADGR